MLQKIVVKLSEKKLFLLDVKKPVFGIITGFRTSTIFGGIIFDVKFKQGMLFLQNNDFTIERVNGKKFIPDTTVF